MQLGLASICSISFSIINTAGRWNSTNFKGVKLTAYLGKSLANGDEYIKLGHFTIEDGVKNEGIINISASDNMALFDTRFKGISFPCTIRQLLVMACFQAGVTFIEPSFGNLDFILDTLENVTAMTCREVVSLGCELLGGFAIINSDGELEVRWFNTNNVNYTIPSQFISSCKPSTLQLASGVSGYFDGEEVIAGTSEALIHLTDNNIFLQNVSFEEKEALVQSIYDNSFAYLSYDPGTIDAKGLCVLEPGDVIRFVHKGQTYRYIVAAFKLTGNLKMTITSTAPSHTSSSSGGYSSSGTSSSTSSMKTAYMLSYEDARLPISSPFADTKELVSVSITKSESHVPVVMFTSNFNCLSEESEGAQVKFTLIASSRTVHEFVQRCHKGMNTANFTWPLIGLPSGATRISVTATVLNDEGPTPNITWLAEDTALTVLGRGFNVASTWNGLILATDNISNITVNSYRRLKDNVAQLNSEARATVDLPNKPSFEINVEPLTVGVFGQNSRVSVQQFVDELTIT